MTNRPNKSLSVCLIVKNEEQMLADCLKSIETLADQIVIVDTGSTDATIEIAKRFNAEIHHFDWIDDFAAARNESIKYATGDWVLWIDADERLSQDSVETLKALLKFEKKPVIYTIRIKNLKEDGVNFTLSDAHRLFTNHRGIEFTGKIHEQVSPSARKVGAEERPCAVVLDHLGYSFSGEEKTKKQSRNRKILLAEVEANPDNAYSHYTLGHNYKVDGELEHAKRHYQIAMKLKQFDSSMEASLLNAYADTLFEMGRLDDVSQLIQKSLKLHRLQNAAHFLSYRVAMVKKDLNLAIQALLVIQEQQTKILASGSDISTDIEIDKATISRALGDLYLQTEQWVKAAESYERCLRNSADSIPVLRNYFKALERLEDWPLALDVLGKLIQAEGEVPAYINAIGTILLRMEEYEGALNIYLRLNQIQPDDENTKRKIASVYAKMGHTDKAQEWL